MNATTNALISASYSEAVTVSFTQEAWFNATAVAAPFEKRPNDWLNLDSTKEYLAALAEIPNYQESWYLKTTRGKFGGTWMHPKLAIPFARWLDVRFAVWCDMQIESILKSRKPNALKDLGTHKALPGGLTIEQQDAVKALVKSRAESIPDQAKWGPAARCMWSSIKSKFGVGYKEVPAEHFTEVLSLVARVPLEGEHIPAGTGPVQAEIPFPLPNTRLLVTVEGGRVAHAEVVGPGQYTLYRRLQEGGVKLVDPTNEESILLFFDQHVPDDLVIHVVVRGATRLAKLATVTH